MKAKKVAEGKKALWLWPSPSNRISKANPGISVSGSVSFEMAFPFFSILTPALTFSSPIPSLFKYKIKS